MAVTQPGGPGTTIFVYDNAHAHAGGDGSYSLADVKAAMDVINPGQGDIEYLLGAITLNPFSLTRRQYLLNVSIQWGGSVADGTNPTTWKDTSIDIHQRVGGMLYRIGGGPIETRLGTSVGAVFGWPLEPTIGGRDGVTYTSNAGQTFRNDLYIYGCRIQTNGALNFNQLGGSVHEVIGNLLISGGANNVFGDNQIVGLYYNNTIVLTTGSNAINGMRALDSRRNILIAPNPLQFLTIPGAQVTGRIQGLVLAGSPSVSDFRSSQSNYGDVYYIDVQHSDNAPRWSFAANVFGGIINNAVKQCARLDTKVVDQNGVGINLVPMRLYSNVSDDSGTQDSYGTLVLDTRTFQEGDLGFIGHGGFQNSIRVRDHYNLASVYTVRDRTYTMLVNVAGGSFPVQPGYESRRIVYEWPGRDVFKGAYQRNGGSFLPCIAPIMLRTGSPGYPVLIEECQL